MAQVRATHLELKDGHSDKYYRVGIVRYGTKVAALSQWGRRGTEGQLKPLPPGKYGSSEEEARLRMDQKLDKGYAEKVRWLEFEVDDALAAIFVNDHGQYGLFAPAFKDGFEAAWLLESADLRALLAADVAAEPTFIAAFEARCFADAYAWPWLAAVRQLLLAYPHAESPAEDLIVALPPSLRQAPFLLGDARSWWESKAMIGHAVQWEAARSRLTPVVLETAAQLWHPSDHGTPLADPSAAVDAARQITAQ
jgi:predicted DNA-binding WGR domain protein